MARLCLRTRTLFSVVGAALLTCGLEGPALLRAESSDWSLAAATLGYTANIAGNTELRMVRGSSAEPFRLTTDSAQDHVASWFPDGARIVSFSDRGLEHGPRELPGHLWVMASDGGDIDLVILDLQTRKERRLWGNGGGGVRRSLLTRWSADRVPCGRPGPVKLGLLSWA